MFRFTIRDLLWLMVVVGVAFGWLAHHLAWKDSYSRLLNMHRRKAAEQKSNLDALHQLSDYQKDQISELQTRLMSKRPKTAD
jgi:hypothetical protein